MGENPICVAQRQPRTTDSDRHRTPAPKLTAGLAVLALGASGAEAVLLVGDSGIASAIPSPTGLTGRCLDSGMHSGGGVFAYKTLPTKLYLRIRLRPSGSSISNPNINPCVGVYQRVLQIWHEKERSNKHGFVRDTRVTSVRGDG